jgi:hypothetical protein
MLLLFESDELLIRYSIYEHSIRNVARRSLSQMAHKTVSAHEYLVAAIAVMLWEAVNSVKMLSVEGLDVSNLLCPDE